VEVLSQAAEIQMANSASLQIQPEHHATMVVVTAVPRDTSNCCIVTQCLIIKTQKLYHYIYQKRSSAQLPPLFLQQDHFAVTYDCVGFVRGICVKTNCCSFNNKIKTKMQQRTTTSTPQQHQQQKVNIGNQALRDYISTQSYWHSNTGGSSTSNQMVLTMQSNNLMLLLFGIVGLVFLAVAYFLYDYTSITLNEQAQQLEISQFNKYTIVPFNSIVSIVAYTASGVRINNEPGSYIETTVRKGNNIMRNTRTVSTSADDSETGDNDGPNVEKIYVFGMMQQSRAMERIDSIKRAIQLASRNGSNLPER